MNTLEYDFDGVNRQITECCLCPRLVAWREEVALTKRASFAGESYWGKAVPNFGDPTAKRLIVGLAPAAHGANRTGRMFTGDRSGDWLFRALHTAEFANQASSISADDGLQLTGVLITAICHCAPPDNKPLPAEIKNCHRYLNLLLRSRRWDSILALGGLAWNEVLNYYQLKKSSHRFAHGAEVILPDGTLLIGSYHPSQQNTFTKRLTEPMLDSVINRFKTFERRLV